MLICRDCGKDASLYMKSWRRNDRKGKVDYRCSFCGSKFKPVEDEQDYHTEYIQKYDNRTTEYKNILVIGDLHLPFSHKNYLKFCEKQYHRFCCDHVIFIGDLIDNNYSSFHNSDPDGYCAGDELDFAIEELSKWNKIFPKADVVLGNHDKIILRKAFSSGISKRWIHDFNAVLGVQWNFQPSFTYNKCLFRHGEGMKASPKSGCEMMSVCQGHHHTEAYVHWNVGAGKKVFGMQVGCAVDQYSYAMAYAQEYPRQILGCGLVLDYGETAFVKLMDL